MKDPFVFYRALDKVKGSWDGYGFYPLEGAGFFAYVADAPSGASVQTPELIRAFWGENARSLHGKGKIGRLSLADLLNRLQDSLIKRGRQDATTYQSTFCVARQIDNVIQYVSIGDSVLQLYRGRRLYRLGGSEVWDASLSMTADEDYSERQRTAPLRFLGTGGEFIQPFEISELELQEGDTLVLSTDGVEETLTPDRVIALLGMDPEEERKEMEKLFAQDRLKDDVTFMQIAPDVPRLFDPEAEIAILRHSQDALRTDLNKVGSLNAKYDRIEKQVQQASLDLQAITKKLENEKSSGGSGTVSIRRPDSMTESRQPWKWIAGAFLAGLIVGLAFFLSRKTPAPAPVVSQQEEAVEKSPTKRTVAPPEILPPANCIYTVEKGDTLEKIAARKKIPLQKLIEWNPDLAKASLQAGWKITVCGDKP